MLELEIGVLGSGTGSGCDALKLRCWLWMEHGLSFADENPDSDLVSGTGSCVCIVTACMVKSIAGDNW